MNEIFSVKDQVVVITGGTGVLGGQSARVGHFYCYITDNHVALQHGTRRKAMK